MNAPAEIKSDLNIDDVVLELAAIRNVKDGLNKQLKELNIQKDDLEKKLVELMKTAGISRASNDVATVSIGEEQVYNATDWDAIYAHVQESGDFNSAPSLV